MLEAPVGERMTGCLLCEAFSERLDFENPDEYRTKVRQLMEVLDQGVLQMVTADCPLQDLFSAVWPADCLEHKLRCAGCGRMFQLFADTYHGRAHWTPDR